MAARGITDIFFDILERVKALDPINVRKWFDDLVVMQFDGGHLDIGCPDEATAQFMEDNCSRNFTKAAQSITGHLVSVSFCVAGGSGAAQAFSCAEYRHATHANTSTVVLWCADQSQDIYNTDLLASYNDLDLHVKIDDRRTPDNEGLSWLDKHCSDYRDSYVVLAGGPGFVYTATDILLGHGFNRNQLHADAYSYAPRQ